MGEITECYILLNSVYLKFEVILLYNLGIFKKKLIFGQPKHKQQRTKIIFKLQFQNSNFC